MKAKCLPDTFEHRCSEVDLYNILKDEDFVEHFPVGIIQLGEKYFPIKSSPDDDAFSLVKEREVFKSISSIACVNGLNLLHHVKLPYEWTRFDIRLMQYHRRIFVAYFNGTQYCNHPVQRHVSFFLLWRPDQK